MNWCSCNFSYRRIQKDSVPLNGVLCPGVVLDHFPEGWVSIGQIRSTVEVNIKSTCRHWYPRRHSICPALRHWCKIHTYYLITYFIFVLYVRFTLRVKTDWYITLEISNNLYWNGLPVLWSGQTFCLRDIATSLGQLQPPQIPSLLLGSQHPAKRFKWIVTKSCKQSRSKYGNSNNHVKCVFGNTLNHLWVIVVHTWFKKQDSVPGNPTMACPSIGALDILNSASDMTGYRLETSWKRRVAR